MAEPCRLTGCAEGGTASETSASDGGAATAVPLQADAPNPARSLMGAIAKGVSCGSRRRKDARCASGSQQFALLPMCLATGAPDSHA